jgi:hypothetical protein
VGTGIEVAICHEIFTLENSDHGSYFDQLFVSHADLRLNQDQALDLNHLRKKRSSDFVFERNFFRSELLRKGSVDLRRLHPHEPSGIPESNHARCAGAVQWSHSKSGRLAMHCAPFGSTARCSITFLCKMSERSVVGMPRQTVTCMVQPSMRELPFARPRAKGVSYGCE